MEILTWIGVGLCLLHSATFSGLNLAIFGQSRLQLEVGAEGGNADAKRLLALRKDSNFLLTTILWGNVAANCLLTLLTDSVLTGVYAFMFSTFGITFFGEIIPQAWFSRNALRMGAACAPLIAVYQRLFWPVAKPSAWLLDRWLGKEGISYLRENDLRRVITKHMEADDADLEMHEGTGVLNYLALDDLHISREGEQVDPASIIKLPTKVDLPLIPKCEASADDPFVAKVAKSGRKWVVLCDLDDNPLLILDADDFLRNLFLGKEEFDPYHSAHRPIVIKDSTMRIGRVLRKMIVHREHDDDDVIDKDIVLLWNETDHRIVTGADILGFILNGIVPSRVSADCP